MRVGLVGEYVLKDGRPHFSPSAEHTFGHIRDNAHTYLIPSHQDVSCGVTALDLQTNSQVLLDPKTLDGVYFGKAAKTFEEPKISYSIVEYLPEFLKLLEIIAQHEYDGRSGPVLVNPAETIVNNLSKRYLLDMPGLPFIESAEAHSLDDLVHAKRQGGMIAKPFISERAKGVIVLDDFAEEELEAYFVQNQKPSVTTPDYHGRVMGSKGILLQPYDESINLYGERKITVVNGEVTLAYKVQEAIGKINAFYQGSQTVPYEPTDKEREIALFAFHTFNQHHQAGFTRIDLVGPQDNLKINEIEAVNPANGEGHYSTQTNKTRNHVEKILSYIKNTKSAGLKREALDTSDMMRINYSL